MEVWEIIHWRDLKWSYIVTFHIISSLTTYLQVGAEQTFFIQSSTSSMNGYTFVVYTVVFMTVVKTTMLKKTDHSGQKLLEKVPLLNFHD